MGESGACYTEWSESEREKQVSHIDAYTESGKMALINRLVDMGGRPGEREGGASWAQRWHVHTAACDTASQWELAVRLRELKPVLCDHLEG